VALYHTDVCLFEESDDLYQYYGYIAWKECSHKQESQKYPAKIASMMLPTEINKKYVTRKTCCVV
jgi:hypothetical protein